MGRLIWKEFRESIWLLVATLGTPLVFILYARFFSDTPTMPWPRQAPEIGLRFVMIAFAAWGATRMPHEREAERLTLRTLPIGAWKVWVVKLLPGILWAVLVGVLADRLGKAGLHVDQIYPGGWHSEWPTAWFMSGIFALSYTAAFLCSLFWGAAISGVVGALSTAVFWFGLLPWQLNMHPNLIGNWAWLTCGALAVISWAMMAVQSVGVSPRRVSVAAAVACIALVIVLETSPGLQTKRYRNSDNSYHFAWQGVLASRAAGWVAGGEVANMPRYNQPQTAKPYMRLWVRKLDGSGRRVISTRDGLLTALAWTPESELLYLAQSTDLKRAQLILWNSRTGASRILGSLGLIDPRNKSSFALEPNGERIAYAERTSPTYGPADSDLWVLEIATGKRHLLWPSVRDSEVLWRNGRIYLRSEHGLKAINPDGGEPYPVSSLPVAKGEDEE